MIIIIIIEQKIYPSLTIQLWRRLLNMGKEENASNHHFPLFLPMFLTISQIQMNSCVKVEQVKHILLSITESYFFLRKFSIP